MEQKHVEIFAGSAIMAMAVKHTLDENNISYVERNDIDSAITAGFGSADKAVHIFVFEEDEEKALQDLVKRIEPDNFDELVAITALYRPGPMESGMVDMYIKNKFNKENIYVEFEEGKVVKIIKAR